MRDGLAQHAIIALSYAIICVLLLTLVVLLPSNRVALIVPSPLLLGLRCSMGSDRIVSDSMGYGVVKGARARRREFHTSWKNGAGGLRENTF